jgi:hypothetical protein
MEKNAQSLQPKTQGTHPTHNTLVKQFDNKHKQHSWPKVAVLLLVMVVLGSGSGLLIAKGSAISTAGSDEVNSKDDVKKGTTFGVNDTATFKDEAEGTLKEGGIEGEGQYHLERPGGPTQSVYLTSSVVDLSILKGRKIKVWGQTQKAQHAPWLMDVGRVEVLN